jgi:hypothetical protein
VVHRFDALLDVVVEALEILLSNTEGHVTFGETRQIVLGVFGD